MFWVRELKLKLDQSYVSKVIRVKKALPQFPFLQIKGHNEVPYKNYNTIAWL